MPWEIGLIASAAIAIPYFGISWFVTRGLVGIEADRAAAAAKARHDATHDDLTGLANRQALMEAASAALDPATGEGGCALIFVDLDGFKDVNDRFGHVAGDAVLRAAGERLRRAVRPADLVARIGGDEFVVLLRGNPAAQEAIRIVERLLACLHAPFSIEGETMQLGASAGLAFGAGGDLAATELMHHADLAMYRAKTRGAGWKVDRVAA